MMTALIVFFGASTTATLFILTAFAVNARTSVVEHGEVETGNEAAPAPVEGNRPIIPAFSR